MTRLTPARPSWASGSLAAGLRFPFLAAGARRSSPGVPFSILRNSPELGVFPNPQGAGLRDSQGDGALALHPPCPRAPAPTERGFLFS